MSSARSRLRRRTLLAAAGGMAISAAGLSVSGPARAADVFDPDWLVAFGADSAFAFQLDTSNAGSGESSPITADYHLSKYQVTNAQYQAFLDDTGGTAPRAWPDGAYWAGKDDHPVLYVPYTSAVAYADWLSGQYTDWTFRLPTEAEWENAARGTDTYAYPWGNSLDTVYADGVLSSHCNYNTVCAAYVLEAYGDTTVTYVGGSLNGQTAILADILSISSTGALTGWYDTSARTGFVYTDLFQEIEDEGGNTSAVGAFPAGDTGTGLADMGGNSWDWTSSEIVATNGQEKGDLVNAIRGGSWYASSRSCATWYRGEGRAPDGGANTVGFRLAAVAA
ncbi:formylglycine-generating enzyme family protein [Actinoplanes sp. NPDC051851]|uniref:formylglycine-generating enzyme family protein n=1 Tax=Actinoplanes sp. NPDC051851 TaxID=3154753 RepID=UPI0034264DF4